MPSDKAQVWKAKGRAPASRLALHAVLMASMAQGLMQKAMVNFHSRAFGGLGKPRTRGLLRLFAFRFKNILRRLGKRLGLVQTKNTKLE